MIQGHDFGMSIPVIILTTIAFWGVVIGVVIWAVKMLKAYEKAKMEDE